jgi:Tol biopolymer transport system component
LPSTDIYLAEFDTATKTIRNVRNVTQREGYDNQPAFTEDGTAMYYVMSDGGPTDIMRYDLATGVTTRVTSTPTAEFSPTPMSDGMSLSVVRVAEPTADGEEYTESQQLWRYDLNGRAIAPIIGTRRVGYHCWISSGMVAMFLVGSEDGSTPHSLVATDLASRQSITLARRIGRTVRMSPHGRLTYVDKSDSTQWVVTTIAPGEDRGTPLLDTPPGSEDFAWLANGGMLMSDGRWFLHWDGKTGTGLRPLGSAVPLDGIIGRIAAGPNGLIAFVVTRR